MIGICARTRHPNAIDIAVHDVDRNAVAFAEKGAELVGDHHRTMPATGAPDGDGEVTFSLAFETWQTKFEQGCDTIQKPATIRLRQDEVFYGLRAAGHFTELRNEVRIVQKTHVEQQIRIDRRAELEAEGHDARTHVCGSACAGAKVRRHFSAKLVHAEPGGVEHQGGTTAQRHEQLAFDTNAVQERGGGAFAARFERGAQRVRPARTGEAAQQRFILGVEEQHRELAFSRNLQ
jgi:hypothetical protein